MAHPVDSPTRTALSVSRASSTATSNLGEGGNVQDSATRWLRLYPREIGDHVLRPPGEASRRGHQVLAGDRYAVDVDHRLATPGVLNR